MTRFAPAPPRLPDAPTAAPARHEAPRAGVTARGERRFRPDIEGLRAVAVVSVVLYHAGLGVRGGYVGVDVFFVISGFLITRQLSGAVGRRGLRALPTFYAHRIRRLLPAAAVVVIATVVVARFVVPPLQVRSTALDGLFTVFYGLNYRLAALGTDYMNAGTAASPLQHFWSLGVEEQFYVVWPVVIVAAFALGRRFRRVVVAAVLLTVLVVSFAYCVRETSVSQPWAYFSLASRAWELAAGGLVALSEPLLRRLPRLLAAPAGLLGLGAVVGSAFVYTDATLFPGTAAAVPVAGAAVVIAAGCGGRRPVERILGEPVAQCLGRASYSWYLWHWPMLVLAPLALGHPLGLLGRGVVVWLSLAAAIVSFLVVEEPSRRLELTLGRWFRRGFVVSVATAAAALLVVANPPTTVGGGRAVELTAAAPSAFDALVAAGVDTRAVPSNLTPAVAAAAHDVPASSSDGCHAGYTQVDQPACVFGDPAGTRTVVLFGDSHVEQWLPAVDAAGRAAGWRVVNWTKAACPAADLTVFAPVLNRTYSECDTWRSRTVARIGALHPDLVLTGQSENTASSSVSPSTFAAATVRTLDALRTGTGGRVLLMDDIPVPNSDGPTCVAAHLGDVRACTFAVSDGYTYPARHAALAPAATAAGFTTVDPQRWICTDRRCPAVVGNVLVYRNATHLTATYSRWLQTRVAPLLTEK